MTTECRHKRIVTWHEEETGEPVALWSCWECNRKFAPMEPARAVSSVPPATPTPFAWYAKSGFYASYDEIPTRDLPPLGKPVPLYCVPPATADNADLIEAAEGYTELNGDAPIPGNEARCQIMNAFFAGHRYASRGVPPATERVTALARFNEDADVMRDEPPLERLRYFCSLAMNGQDWLDAEPFFAALAAAPAVSAPAAPAADTGEWERACLDALSTEHDDEEVCSTCGKTWGHHYGRCCDATPSARFFVAAAVSQASGTPTDGVVPSEGTSK